jgi:ABC-2 type transport system ATP-binding protein
MSTILDVQAIDRRFGALLAVSRVSFQVQAGEIYGFIGPNGAGKTTTMRICATLDLPDAGDVLVDGISVIEDPRRVRHKLGFMPDAYGMYPNTTIAEYLDFFARAYGLRGAERSRALQEVMDFTSLQPLAGKEMTALSKGMRQRLCLAKTMLHDPTLFILDEPAAGLDPRARVELRELLLALAEMGKAILISSHILTELSELCDGVAVIEQGVIRATGSVEDIVRQLKPHAQVFLRGLAEADTIERFLAEQPHIDGVRGDGEGFVFDFHGTEAQLAELLSAAVRQGVQPIEFRPDEIDLEDIFLSLTEGKVQ